MGSGFVLCRVGGISDNNCRVFPEGNRDKNRLKHQVSLAECEQIFFNRPLVVQDDVMHSKTEKRFYALGKTDSARAVFIAFAIRENRIRIISARNVSHKEGEVYNNE